MKKTMDADVVVVSTAPLAGGVGFDATRGSVSWAGGVSTGVEGDATGEAGDDSPAAGRGLTIGAGGGLACDFR